MNKKIKQGNIILVFDYEICPSIEEAVVLTKELGLSSKGNILIMRVTNVIPWPSKN